MTTKLEQEFKSAYDSVIDEINSELAEAEKHLSKAVELSEQHGIPFSSGISFLGQGYVPDSFKNKFPEIDRDFVADLTCVYDEYGGFDGGWEHSAVC